MILKKLFTVFVMLPLGLIMIALLVANRHSVNFILDPFVDAEYAAKIDTLPFFAYLLAAAFVGLIVGSFVTWIGQARWRRTAKKRAREAHQLRKKADQLLKQIEMTKRTANQLPPPEEAKTH